MFAKTCLVSTQQQKLTQIRSTGQAGNNLSSNNTPAKKRLLMLDGWWSRHRSVGRYTSH